MHKEKMDPAEITEIEILPLADEDLQSVLGSLKDVSADQPYCSIWCCSNGCETQL